MNASLLVTIRSHFGTLLNFEHASRRTSLVSSTGPCTQFQLVKWGVHRRIINCRGEALLAPTNRGASYGLVWARSSDDRETLPDVDSFLIFRVPGRNNKYAFVTSDDEYILFATTNRVVWRKKTSFFSSSILKNFHVFFWVGSQESMRELYILPPAGTDMALKSVHDTYLQHDPNGVVKVGPISQPCSKFSMIPQGDTGIVALLSSCSGRYLSVSRSGKVSWNAQKVGKRERILVQRCESTDGPQCASLMSAYGFHLSFTPFCTVRWNSKAVNIWGKFLLSEYTNQSSASAGYSVALDSKPVPCKFFLPTMSAHTKSTILNLLQNIHRAFVSANIDYTIAYGTALGHHRHGGFIPWDDDTDIILASIDSARARELVPPFLCTSDFYAGWKVHHCTNKATPYPFVDVFVRLPPNRLCSYHGGWIPKTSDLLFPSLPIVFEGIELRGPRDPDAYLAHEYGDISNCLSPPWDHVAEKWAPSILFPCERVRRECFSEALWSMPHRDMRPNDLAANYSKLLLLCLAVIVLITVIAASYRRKLQRAAGKTA